MGFFHLHATAAPAAPASSPASSPAGSPAATPASSPASSPVIRAAVPDPKAAIRDINLLASDHPADVCDANLLAPEAAAAPAPEAAAAPAVERPESPVERPESPVEAVESTTRRALGGPVRPDEIEQVFGLFACGLTQTARRVSFLMLEVGRLRELQRAPIGDFLVTLVHVWLMFGQADLVRQAAETGVDVLAPLHDLDDQPRMTVFEQAAWYGDVALLGQLEALDVLGLDEDRFGLALVAQTPAGVRASLAHCSAMFERLVAEVGGRLMSDTARCEVIRPEVVNLVAAMPASTRDDRMLRRELLRRLLSPFVVYRLAQRLGLACVVVHNRSIADVSRWLTLNLGPHRFYSNPATITAHHGNDDEKTCRVAVVLGPQVMPYQLHMLKEINEVQLPDHVRDMAPQRIYEREYAGQPFVGERRPAAGQA